MNKLNTPIKNSSLYTILHIYGCLFRDRVKTNQWLSLSSDITEFHFVLCTFLYCLNFIGMYYLFNHRSIKIIKGKNQAFAGALPSLGQAAAGIAGTSAPTLRSAAQLVLVAPRVLL